MKIIAANKIKSEVAKLCMKAAFELPKEVLSKLRKVYSAEKNKRAKNILKAILDNADYAKKEKLAICQDTGLPVIFVELGQDVKIKGDLKKAIHQGVEEGYKKAYLRNSIVKDPLIRGKSVYSPAIIHFDIVKGSKIKITVLPKGFGCENKSQLKMFNPTANIEEIKKFIIEVVKIAGPDACPPYVVGVGIGGSADYAALLAKKALLRSIAMYDVRNTIYAKFEQDLLKRVNNLNIGPMGLGGKNTCLAVNIESYPTHIAGLPVAVNISCHALRKATAII